MKNDNNVNANAPVSSNHNDNYNDIDRSKRVESIALQLVSKFGSQDSYPFYCKVAYKLPEHTIWNNYEQSLKGRQPGALFNFLCRKAMG